MINSIKITQNIVKLTNGTNVLYEPHKSPVLYGLNCGSSVAPIKVEIVDSGTSLTVMTLFTSSALLSISWKAPIPIVFTSGISYRITNLTNYIVDCYITSFIEDSWSAYSTSFTKELEEELSKD